MRTAVRIGDTIAIRPNMFVGRFGPLQCDLNALIPIFSNRERRVMNRSGISFREYLGQIVGDPLLMKEAIFLAIHFIDKEDANFAM